MKLFQMLVFRKRKFTLDSRMRQKMGGSWIYCYNILRRYNNSYIDHHVQTSAQKSRQYWYFTSLCWCWGDWGVLRVDHYSYYYFQEWIDNNLRWNESEYGNVKDLRFPPSTIWTPDILMYNRYQLDRRSWMFGFIEANLGMQPLLADWANIVLTQISIYLRSQSPRQPRIYFAHRHWIYCCLPLISQRCWILL